MLVDVNENGVMDVDVDVNVGLASACEGGHLDCVRFMIEKGANDWQWGLSNACNRPYNECVRFMCANKTYALTKKLKLIKNIRNNSFY